MWPPFCFLSILPVTQRYTHAWANSGFNPIPLQYWSTRPSLSCDTLLLCLSNFLFLGLRASPPLGRKDDLTKPVSRFWGLFCARGDSLQLRLGAHWISQTVVSVPTLTSAVVVLEVEVDGTIQRVNHSVWKGKSKCFYSIKLCQMKMNTIRKEKSTGAKSPDFFWDAQNFQDESVSKFILRNSNI